MPRKSEIDKKREALELRRTEIEVREKELTVQRMEREEDLAKELELRRAMADMREKELNIERMEREEAQAKSDLAEHLTYQFFEEVDESTVKEAITELTKWGKRFPKRPIKLILNSPGGSVIHGLALYDCLRGLSKSGHKLTVVVYGAAASMGSVIAQAGDVRQIGFASHLMLHEVHSVSYGKIFEIEDDLKFTKKLWNKMLDIYALRCKLPKKEIAMRAKKTDWWMSAEEAVAFGFFDEVV